MKKLYRIKPEFSQSEHHYSNGGEGSVIYSQSDTNRYYVVEYHLRPIFAFIADALPIGSYRDEFDNKMEEINIFEVMLRERH